MGGADVITDAWGDFRSDNVGPVSPEILDAMSTVNFAPASAYGKDGVSALLNRRYSDLFETDVTVFPVATGTAANALALAACARPYGGIFCYEHAHIVTSEGAATEAFSGGARLIPLAGDGFRVQSEVLGEAVAAASGQPRHKPQPNAVSVTQATEHGTVYRPDELASIGAVARRSGLKFHMDGARFANALARIGCSAAEITWRCGVDILSFGVTKNGGLNFDAIVVFDQNLTEDLSYRLRRAGQTWSKMRFAAAGLLSYIDDGLFLGSAARANALTDRLDAGLRNVRGIRSLAPVEANLIFCELPEPIIEALKAEGFLFFQWKPRAIRLVCRFDGTEDEVDRFLTAVRRLTSAGASSATVPQR